MVDVLALVNQIEAVCPITSLNLLNNPPAQASDVQIVFDPSATAQQQAAAQAIINGLTFVPLPVAVQNAKAALQAFEQNSTPSLAQVATAIKAQIVLDRFIFKELNL